MKWADTPYATLLVTAPAAEPVTYTQVKAFLRLPDDTDETLVRDLIRGAREKVEQNTGLRLLTQTWDVLLDAFPDDAIRLPLCPVQSITSITTTPPTGVPVVLTAGNYQLDVASWPPRLVLSDTGAWPSTLRATQGIAIRCVAGWATPALVPQNLADAIRGLVAVDYQVRTGVGVVVPPRWLGYDALIGPYRLPGVA